MPDGFDAGSIFVQLRAELADFNAGLAQAKSSLDNLATGSKEVEVAFTELDTSVVVFTELEETLSKAGDAFGSFSNKVSQSSQQTKAQTQATNENAGAHDRASISWQRSANRILTVQLALLQLTQNASGPAKDAIQGLSNGFSVAAASMRLFGDNISALGGGLIGAGVTAISFFTRYMEDAIKATDTLTESQIKSQRVINNWKNNLEDANDRAEVFKDTLSGQLAKALGVTEAAFAANQKRLREIPDEISAIQQKISALTDTGSKDLRENLLSLVAGVAGVGAAKLLNAADEKALENLNQQLQILTNQQGLLISQQLKIAQTAPWNLANAEVVKLNEKLQETQAALAEIKERGALGIQLGIEEPIQAATDNLTAAKKVLDEMLADNDRIRQIALSGKIATDQIDAFLAKNLHTDTDIGTAAAAVKAALQQKQSIEAVNDLAKTFSTSIGDGLRDAILNAQKPMEALATIGKNLFANMIDQTVKRLETGLTEAFKAITGAAGEGIGLAITGILGAAGAILSKLGSKGSDSFGNVQSAVTSSQAVRGIVAGPSSVAIADVGDNLSRAVQPLLNQMIAAVDWLRKIEGNTRGGGGGGGGTPQVAVATR